MMYIIISSMFLENYKHCVLLDVRKVIKPMHLCTDLYSLLCKHTAVQCPSPPHPFFAAIHTSAQPYKKYLARPLCGFCQILCGLCQISQEKARCLGKISAYRNLVKNLTSPFLDLTYPFAGLCQELTRDI